MNALTVHRPRAGQTSLEYLLLIAVVAVVVIAGFSQGSLMDQTGSAAKSYFSSVASAISGQNPQPINGNWCPGQAPSPGVGPQIIYLACECPAPAFGGKNCNDPNNPITHGSGGTITTGDTLPTGGSAVCNNGLTCNGANGSPIGSFPSPDCTACWCPASAPWVVNGQCTAATGSSCTADNCTGECLSNGSCCTKTPTCGSSTCGTDACGVVCGTCPQGQSCVDGSGNATAGPGTCMASVCNQSTCSGQCINGVCCTDTCGSSTCGTACGSPCGSNNGLCLPGESCLDGNGNITNGPGICTKNACGPTCAGECVNGVCCTATPTCGTSNCGKDNCGMTCGADGGSCGSGLFCVDGSGQVTTGPGTCSSCSALTCPGPEECTTNGSCCMPQMTTVNGQQEALCSVLPQCGSTLGVDSCGNVCVGTANTCPPQGGDPRQTTCDLSSLKCLCGSCHPLYCNSDVGYDDCNYTCITAEPAPCDYAHGYTCSAEGICTAPPPPTPPCTCLGIDCKDTQGYCEEDGFPCNTATPVACSPPASFCNMDTGVCECPPTSPCTATACGSFAGTNICGEACTATTPGTQCPPNLKCDMSTGQCICPNPGVCPMINGVQAVCGPDTCGNPNGCATVNCAATGLVCNLSTGQCGCPTGYCSQGGACVPDTCATTPCGQNDACGTPCLYSGTCSISSEICWSGSCQCPQGSCYNTGHTACVAASCSGVACGQTDNCGNICSSGSCLTPPGAVCTPTPLGDKCLCPAADCLATDGSGCVPQGTGCTATNPTCGMQTCGQPDACGNPCKGQCVSTFTLHVTDFGNCQSCAGICSVFQLEGTDCGKQADCGAGCGIVDSACVVNDATIGAQTCGTCLNETYSSGIPCPDGINTVLCWNYANEVPADCTAGTPGSADVTYTVVCNP